jgi:hypothetical protein
MKQFCEDVIKFLKLTYGDAYEYRLEKHVVLQHLPSTDSFSKVELWIKLNPCFILKIPNDIMQYLFRLYSSSENISEQGLYGWQKKLIDMIEDN